MFQYETRSVVSMGRLARFDKGIKHLPRNLGLAPALHDVLLAQFAFSGKKDAGMSFLRDPANQGVSPRLTNNENQNQSGNGELERLAQFFPAGTRVKMPVQVARLPFGSSQPMTTVLEYGTPREVIFRCALPIEFGDRVRLTNKDGSLDAEAEVMAVQIGATETLIAARFTAEIPNWIIKS